MEEIWNLLFLGDISLPVRKIFEISSFFYGRDLKSQIFQLKNIDMSISKPSVVKCAILISNLEVGKCEILVSNFRTGYLR